MKRRDFLKYVSVSAAALAFGGCGKNAALSRVDNRPNIILIMADDLGYGDVGCNGGTNLAPTPNIDRLAAQGVRFTDGYVTAPVCGPCRYGMLTGAYQQRFGVQWNQDCYGRLPADVLAKLGIQEESLESNRIPWQQKIINQPFDAAGYATAMTGKWNLPCYPKTTFAQTMSVMHFGGDYFPDEAGHYSGVDEQQPTSGQKDIFWGPKSEGDEYLTDVLGDNAVRFIESHKEEPFFLYLAFNAPHSPMQAKKSHLQAVEHIKSEALRLYAAMTIAMDENVGKVLDALERLKLADNTIVAFLSDNGPSFAYNVDWPKDWPRELLGSAGGLSGHKGQFLEGGIRVPFIIRWPNQLKGGQVYTEPVSALDFYPTFAAAANVEVPEGTILDGVNLLPFLKGDSHGLPHRWLFWYAGVSGAVRSGRWKLLVYKDSFKLYDLQADIAETTDLAQSYPQKLAEMSEKYRMFCLSMPPSINWKQS